MIYNYTDNEPCNKTGDLILRSIVDFIGKEIVGRLEICYDGYWGSICGYQFSDTVAIVACKNLGYAKKGNLYIFVFAM